MNRQNIKPDLRMKELSIVVASKNTRRTIEPCLEALVGQCQGDDLEILVVDASSDGSAEIAGRFKQITLVQADPACLVPELWRIGIQLSGGRWVAFTTANFIPAKNWVAEMQVLVQSHHAAIGGVFEKRVPDKISQWAIYFLRYAAYLPSIAPHRASQLAADNAAYQRWVFDKYAEIIEDGFWEYPVNRGLNADGHSLFLTPDLRVSMGYFSPPGEFFIQRFHHGRVFGAERVAKVSPTKRLFYILTSPLIPLVLLLRVSRHVIKNNTLAGKLFLSLPWILFYIVGWSSGELFGYLIRTPPAKRAQS
jgi:glycosyltransferase involved in cell wall biosynthesis